MHSKYCRKKVSKWGKESSADKDSSLKGISSGERPKEKRFSRLIEKADEFSLGSTTSSSSKRRRSPSSRSPSLEEFLRKLSCSPVRKRSISPIRPRIPYRKRVSPIRKHSSPFRRYSRSPSTRHSRSPRRRHSRSPYRKRSRSPFRRRSPARKHIRSPLKRRSRSPLRRRSRSPHRRNSRSPIWNRSRSPLWSASKGHSRRSSRSPYRKVVEHRISRSPEKAPIRLPTHAYSKSPIRRSKSPLGTHPHSRSSLRSDSRPSEDPPAYKSSSYYKYSKDSVISPGSYESTSKLPHSHHRSETEARRDLNDLDEISDEDETKYFNTADNPLTIEVIKNLPESARAMLVKVLQRFSITNINPNDPSFFELMKFVASHSTEIQRLMSQPSVFTEANAPVQSNPTVKSQDSFLQQYLLANMKRNLSSPGGTFLSTPGRPSGPADVHFLQGPGPSTSGSQFLPQSSGLPTNQFPQPVLQQPNPLSQYPVQNIHPSPPQVHPQQMFMNSPLGHQHPFQPVSFKAASPQKPAMALPTKPRTEGMFKDLKAAVNKIFGGEDVLSKIGIKIPGFNDHPSPEKWDENPSSVLQNNPEPQTSFHGNRNELDFHNITKASTRPSDNPPKNYPKDNAPYFDEVPRPAPHAPPPDAKVSFCDVQRSSIQRNLFPVVGNSETMPNYDSKNSQISVNDAKKSLAQRLAAVLVKAGMTDVPAHLLQEMLMKIGAFSLNPPQDISEGEILGILRKLKYLS